MEMWHTHSEPIECSPLSTSISSARANNGTRYSRVGSVTLSADVAQ